LRAVVNERLAFWAVLAEDQGRAWTADLDGDAVSVNVPPDDLGSAIDAVIANILAHTDEGTGFEVSVVDQGAFTSVIVDDEGPGFPSELMARGRSGGGSTGLGLDIARQVAERGGGGVRIGRSPSGGAQVELSFPVRPAAAPPPSRGPDESRSRRS
jgi:signal transduction histidine kinase